MEAETLRHLFFIVLGLELFEQLPMLAQEYLGLLEILLGKNFGLWQGILLERNKKRRITLISPCFLVAEQESLC